MNLTGSIRGDFQYAPLTHPRSIRVLHLHRDLFSANETITGTLEEVNLDDPNLAYHAISYTWGNPTPQIPIQCNGRTLLITRSCDEALRRLMRGKLGRTVWVDGICINQESLDERAQQVQLMETVYRNASKVLVWLGPGTEGSDLAMSKLRGLAVSVLLGRQRQVLQDLFEFDAQNTATYPFGILAEIFRRPWFQRIWVIQEVVMAKADSVMFYCGEKMIHFVNLCAAIEPDQNADLTMVQRHWTYYTALLRGFRQAVRLRDEDRPPLPGFDLSTTLLATLFKKATEPVDKIFGFYGMARHLGWQLPTPDYRAPLVQVYADATRAAVETDNSLLMFHLATGPKKHDLPSWVPDYSQLPSSLFKMMHGFTPAGASQVAVRWPSGFNSTEIVVSGILLDVVDVCGSPVEWPMEQTMYHDQRPTIDMSVNALQVAQSWLCLASDLSEYYEATAEPIIHAFARTLFMDGLTTRNAAGAVRLYMEQLHPFLTGPVPSLEGMMQANARSQRFEYACSLSIFSQTNRAFVLTGGGRMATVPALTRKHDLIVIFAGSFLPSVVRQREEKFELIGPAYIHGAMDGEMWPRDDRRLDEFVLI